MTMATAVADTACERAQIQLVEGELDSDLRQHVEACPECSFFASLSQHLGATHLGAGRQHTPDPLGAGLASVLELAAADGSPLLGRYRLQKLVGRGGQGRVYRAIDEETGDVVALKTVRVGEDDWQRSAQEVSHARRIRHPNVCRVYHTERHGGIRLIVMEFIDGPRLSDRLGKLTQAVALRVFERIASAVQAAHDAGVLHLDLKPHNVLMRSDEEPVVTDFGLSVPLSVGTSAQAGGGTPAYMAPEQRRGAGVDRRADIYALGLILRDLAGSDAPTRVKLAIERATKEDPGDRFDTVEALLSAVRHPARWRPPVVLVAVALMALGAASVASYAVQDELAANESVWLTDAWGIDTVPKDLVNLASNPGGTGLPRVTTSHPPWACGNSEWELVDGVTQYANWAHGYAFPPSPEEGPGYCVSLELLPPKGDCGVIDPQASLCKKIGLEDEYELLDYRVSELSEVTQIPKASLGQFVAFDTPCGDRWVTVELDAVREVHAVRTWHHGYEHAPVVFRIEVSDDGEAFEIVFSTNENHQAVEQEDHRTNAGGHSAPITAQFPPVTTRFVRFVMDTCSTRGLACPEIDHREVRRQRDRCPPGHGWLYEIEVFGPPEPN